MLFNSIEYLFFFVFVVTVYYVFPYKWRWLLLLVASYFFYMNWNPIYAVLIFLSTLTTYASSILIEKTLVQSKKKLYLVLNLIFNLGILFIFKYFDFVNQSIFAILNLMGIRWEISGLELLLPVGISFYTFQAIGYSIDVYKKKIKPEHHFGRYALFVSFFPQLVAGPIERASHLLPQFKVKHDFNEENFFNGLRQIVWGLFMKVAVADRLSIYVDAVYNNIDKHNGTTLWLATLLFAFQIYCDFAGYSNMAIGSARIMGFDLMENFRRPYFSKSISEFWSRWHISLSTWFKDYVYIPLGGNRVNLWKHLRNLMITFIISGLWHGANWTFVWWGMLHGIYLILEVLRKKWDKKFTLKISKGQVISKSLSSALKIGSTFMLVIIAWVFFRANSIQDAFLAFNKMTGDFSSPFLNKTELTYGIFCLFILLAKELKDEYQWSIKLMSSSNLIISGISTAVVLYLIVLLGVVDSDQFIYFQF